MIIVTGTKRSGTSMWMQTLVAAGIPVIGKAFPGRWKDTIGDANPDGFYESAYRDGIHFQTNPHPKTGEYLAPDVTRHHAVKVFVPGLRRSDLAFVYRVLVAMRPLREYCSSITRLHAMEHENRNRLDSVDRPRREYVHPALEWWDDIFGVVGDVLLRNLPAHFVAYDTVLADPEPAVREVIAWLGVGDADAAVRAIKPERRTQRLASTGRPDALPDYFTDEFLATCDELYERIRERRGIDGPFIDRLNAVDAELAPHVISERRRLAIMPPKRRPRAAAESEKAP